MGCEHKEGGGFYHRRQPQQTPFYQLVERFYPRFEAVYEDRYQERYGFWRPLIGRAVEEFPADGAFLPLPKLATEPFLKLWEQEVFKLLLAEGKITEEIVANIRSWQHPGFSVDHSVRVEAGDSQGIQRLIEYFLRCPFSQARMIEITGEGKVICKTADNRLGGFPEAAREDLLAGPKRNFQVFDPLDFLAEVTQHVPDPGEHLIRYYGWYSNKSRGLRAKGQPAAARPAQEQGPSAREARQRWAALIKQVYEVDPLLCPKCGGTMKIISFIERHQSEVIERILRHCGPWEEESARAPPEEQMAVG
jgi:Putative transposase